MMKQFDSVKLEIVEGALIVNHATLLHVGSTIVAIEIDMKSKRGEVIASGSNGECPVVVIAATEDSLNLDPQKPREEPTSIAFPQFKGWSLFVGELSRYTLYVCLTKG